MLGFDEKCYFTKQQKSDFQFYTKPLLRSISISIHYRTRESSVEELFKKSLLAHPGWAYKVLVLLSKQNQFYYPSALYSFKVSINLL